MMTCTRARCDAVEKGEIFASSIASRLLFFFYSAYSKKKVQLVERRRDTSHLCQPMRSTSFFPVFVHGNTEAASSSLTVRSNAVLWCAMVCGAAQRLNYITFSFSSSLHFSHFFMVLHLLTMCLSADTRLICSDRSVSSASLHFYTQTHTCIKAPAVSAYFHCLPFVIHTHTKKKKKRIKSA